MSPPMSFFLSIGLTNTTTGTVLLHLYAGVLARRRKDSFQGPTHALYIPVPSPFPQLESFISQAVRDYNLDLFKCNADPPIQTHDSLPSKEKEKRVEPTAYAVDEAVRSHNIRSGEEMSRALQIYKDRFPNISAILVGTRRTDPHGGESLLYIL